MPLQVHTSTLRQTFQLVNKHPDASIESASLAIEIDSPFYDPKLIASVLPSAAQYRFYLSITHPVGCVVVSTKQTGLIPLI